MQLGLGLKSLCTGQSAGNLRILGCPLECTLEVPVCDSAAKVVPTIEGGRWMY